MTRPLRGLIRGSSRRGTMLLGVGAVLVMVIGMAVLAVDVGRMYIVKSELQTFTDAGALAAGLQLDGTAEGIARAQGAVQNLASGPNAMKWDLFQKPITTYTISYAKPYANDATRADPATWTTNPADPKNYRFADVDARAGVPLNFSMAFLQYAPSVSPMKTASVGAMSMGGQQVVNNYPIGLLPFSPIAQNLIAPTFGMVHGVQYTLRYPSQGGIKKENVCDGDVGKPYLNNIPSQDRGYWGSTSAAVLRGEIIHDEQLQAIIIGEPVPMVGGNKNTEASALDERVREDSDATTATYDQYIAEGRGNGRRIVPVPINDGPTHFIAVGIGAFFLQPTPNYQSVTGNTPICAEYIGPYVQGSMYRGAATAASTGDTGGYSVRLLKKD